MTRKTRPRPPIDRSLTWDEVEAIVRLTQHQVSKLVVQGVFPAHIRTGARRKVWRESDIEAYMEQRRGA